VDTWRAGAITCYDVGDMAIGYVACGAITYCDVGDMVMEYVERKSAIYTWHIDTWKSIGGTYQISAQSTLSTSRVACGVVRMQVVLVRVCET
jgi:hypothetical protein